MSWLQSPFPWSPVLLLALGLSLLGGSAVFLQHLRRQVQAAWAEAGRIHQRSTARFAAVGELLEDALFETDASRTLTYANGAFLDITGFRHRDLRSGLNLDDLFSRGDERTVQRALDELRAADDVRVERTFVSCRDGARVPVSVRLSAVTDDRHVVGWRGLLETRPDQPQQSDPLDGVLSEILNDVGTSPPEQLQDALERGLAAIGQRLGLDRCYHYAADPHEGNLRAFGQWYAGGVSPMAGEDRLPGLAGLPWALQRLSEDGAVVVDDVALLGPEAGGERSRWQQQGITSLMLLPLRNGPKIEGVLGCETLGRTRRWTASDRRLVAAMAQICQRIQNHRLAEAQLDEANQRTGQLAELLPEPVAVVDRAGGVLAWNAPMAEVSGRAADAVQGRPAIRVMEEFLPGAGAWVRALFAGDRGEARSEVFPSADRWLQITVNPLRGQEWLLHLCDVTRAQQENERIRDRNASLERLMEEREQQLEDAQARLLESQKNLAMAGMVTGLAHELNTPVGVGLTAASHLQDHAERLAHSYQDGLMRRSEFEEFLGLSRESSGLILGNLQRAADLVSGMRQAAVDQAAELKRPVPLGQYLNDVLLSLRPRLRERNVEVRLDCADDIVVEADPSALYRIVSNLVINAVQHAFDGMLVGTIAIGVADVDDRIVLTIRDDGRGMQPEERERIYDPFFTTARDSGGMGLGMHIVYNLVTRTMAGTIACESAPGKGTTFRIALPRQPREDEDVRVRLAH